MNNGDRGGISSLIKLIRPKASAAASATSKAKNAKAKEAANPSASFTCSMICICNHNIDKKISEIMKQYHSIYLPPPHRTRWRESRVGT